MWAPLMAYVYVDGEYDYTYREISNSSPREKDCFWNNTPTQTGQNVSAVNLATNGTLQAGESLTMGFQVNGIGTAALVGLTATGESNPSSGFNLTAVAKTTTVWATASAGAGSWWMVGDSCAIFCC